MAKAKPAKLKVPKSNPSPIAIGIDLSLSSLALSAKMYDHVLAKMVGPAWHITRWQRGFSHDEKLAQVSKAHDFIHQVIYELNGGIIHSVEHLYIGVEELPPRQMNAQRYREQSEIIGSFVGGLKRYGFANVNRVNITKWQALVAADLDKKVTQIDKWSVKNWAIEVYDAPKWTDLIYNSKQGLIPKPKGSKAMPAQPDDRYDSTGIMDWVWENYAGKILEKANARKL